MLYAVIYRDTNASRLLSPKQYLLISQRFHHIDLMPGSIKDAIFDLKDRNYGFTKVRAGISEQ